MSRALFAGLMSGTSLDGVDAVLLDLGGRAPRVRAHVHHPFDALLRAELLALNASAADELDRAAHCANELARRYAGAIRALLAELSGICVVADFRSRDVAAGGQGAPLAPAFHTVMFGSDREDRAVLNLGGMANLTWLPAVGAVTGFDTGPGNCLLDLWAEAHLGKAVDEDGAWAAGATADAALLGALLAEPYFALPPPKSTGRDLFNAAWLSRKLPREADPRVVQATLLELTALSVAQAIRGHCQGARRLIVCGGGVSNGTLMARLENLLSPVTVDSSAHHGIDPMQVEAAAFAWLAQQALRGKPGNLPAVTGARGARVLGAIYPP